MSLIDYVINVFNDIIEYKQLYDNDKFVKEGNYVKYTHKTRKGETKTFIKKSYYNIYGGLMVNSNHINDVEVLKVSDRIERLLEDNEVLFKNGEVQKILNKVLNYLRSY